MNKNIVNQFEKTVDEIIKLKEVSQPVLVEPIKEGKWSIREIVGHLFYWDKYNLEQMVPLMSDGAKLPPFPNHDQHNEEAITYLENFRSVDTIIDSFAQTRKELIDRLTALDEDVRFTIGTGKRKFSPESFVKIFLKHDLHHLKQMEEKLDEKGS